MTNILFYNGMWTDEMTLPAIDFPPDFYVTTDRSRFEQMDAVVFHMPSLELDIPLEKPENQLWVFWSMECEKHYPHLMQPEVRDLFDIFMTYHLDADVAVPYMEAGLDMRLRQPPVEKSKGICMFVSSNFNQSNRISIIRELMAEIPVDSYGSLFRNSVIQDDKGLATKMDIIKNYHFTISFENAIAKDYVTEKFFDPMIAGSVPVYLGAPNISSFAPGNNCFINALEYGSVKELADYLRKLMDHKDEYQQYMQWKTQPFLPAFVAGLGLTSQHPFTRLCYSVKALLDRS